MRLTVFPATSILEGDLDVLSKINEHFSFTNKAAQNELRRFNDSLKYKERAIRDDNGDLPKDYLAWKTERLTELKSKVKVYLCSYKEEQLLFPTGLLQSLLESIKTYNLKIDISDERNFDTPRRALKGEKPRELRRPQQEALDVILNNHDIPNKGIGMIRLATGVGKTALAQELIRNIGARSIFLVPSLPILKQTLKRFEAAFGSKNVKVYGGGKKNIGYVTVATYQSVYAGDPADFKDIDLMVADEVHHVGAESFYDVAVNKLGNAVYRFGLTAFEERADGGTQLVEAAVGPVIYKFDAPEAIEEGYLARPTFMIYDVWTTRGTWTKYKIKDGKRTAVGTEKSIPYDGSDDITAYRNWMLGNDVLNSFIAQMVEMFVSTDKSILILVDEKEHGERLMKLIPDAGFAVGGGKDNEKLQKLFNARKLKVLIGTSTLGEGADTVPVDVLINLQGGASKSKVLQANGRALRNDPDPDTGIPRKPDTLIIDFNFPLCKYLARHSEIREKIHKTLGQVHRGKIS